MLPKKTFTMSYILKKAISKAKVKDSLHNHSLKCPKKTRTMKADKSTLLQNKLLERSICNIPANLKTSEKLCLPRVLGDIYLLNDEKNTFQIFDVMNQSKKIKQINYNKAANIFDFFLFEDNYICETIEEGIAKLRSIKNHHSFQLAEIIEKGFSSNFDSLITEPKIQLAYNSSFKNFKDEIFRMYLEYKSNHMLMIHYERTKDRLETRKITINGNFMKLIHNVDAENIEKVMKNDKLPNCFEFSLSSYYEIMDLVMNCETNNEKKITVLFFGDDQNKLEVNARCIKHSFLSLEREKMDICLFLVLEIESRQLRELEKSRKKKIMMSNLHENKENWNEFIDHYYNQSDPIQKIESEPENKRCLYKIID